MEQEEAGWQENELFALKKTEFLFVGVKTNLVVILKNHLAFMINKKS